MAREPSQKLVDYGIIAGIALAAYFVYTAFFKKEAPKVCPAGQHAVNPCEGQIGWPAFLCNLGRNVTGAFLDCKPDSGSGDLSCPAGSVLENGVCKPVNVPVVPLQRDSFGCLIETQRWCPIDKMCMDNARSCTPEPSMIPSPGACYEWSPTFHEWVYSPTMPGCVPYYEIPPVIPRCAESECTPGVTMCDNGISKICVPLGIGCEDRGFWDTSKIDLCKELTNIVKCSCGLVDLNNPPGNTCQKACATLIQPVVTNKFYFECLQDAMNQCPGPEYTSPNCVAKRLACMTDTSKNNLANASEVAKWKSECPGVVGGLPVDTPIGTFSDARDFTEAFGHVLISEIHKGYTGGDYPMYEHLICYKQNPTW